MSGYTDSTCPDRPDDWRERGACLGRDPEFWFPIGDSTAAARRQTREAVAICLGCEVAYDCLKWALDEDIEFGIFGGRTETERRSAKRRGLRARARVSA